MDPLLSVIVVTKDDKQNLLATLESIPTDPRIEIIVQDGESKFSVEEVLAANSRRSQIKLQIMKDTGIYHAMNLAVTRSQGDFICFLNCGDLFTPFAERGLLDVVLALEDKYKAIKFLANTQDNGVQIERASPLYFFRRMLNHQSIVYKRSVFEEHFYDEEFRIAADLKHFLESKLISKVAYVDVVLIEYLGNGIATTKKMINQNWKERATVCKWRISAGQKLIIFAAVVVRSILRLLGFYK